MKQAEVRGYIVTVMSEEVPRGGWNSRWSAIRTHRPFEAHFKDAESEAPYSTESEADDAGLREGCAWIESHGRR